MRSNTGTKYLLILCLSLSFTTGASVTLGVEYGSFNPGGGSHIGLYSLFGERGQHYLDIKGTFDPVSDYERYEFTPYFAEDVLGNRYVGTRTEYVVVNYGRVIRYGIASMIVAGGLASRTVFREYYNKSGLLGEDQRYFLEESERTLINLGVGLGVEYGRFNFKLHYDSAVEVFSGGVGFIFY